MSRLENDRPLLIDRIDEEEEETAYDETEKVHIVRDEDDNERDLEYGVGCGGAPPFSWRKLWLFTGPGFLMSIAFLDPGNLEGDLQSGAVAGYSLLWLLMWATAMGLLVQLLSARLGVATGRHLAELCREEYPSWAGMVLWVMAELALIGSDIQEVIGSAIAIKILTNGILPLWAGVIITALDCFFFLFFENYGIRKLEAVFAVLIATMGVSFAWMFGQAKPSGSELLVGILVPKLSSRTIQKAVGVVGCIIMPHNVFLHSALVQSREVDKRQKYRVQEAINYYTIESTLALFVSFLINLFVTTVFAKGFYNTDLADSIGLVNAGQYLQDKYGGGLFPILYIWGIGLLAAGQSSTITGTYAGQFIMGGFLNFRMKKWMRALITRSCAIIPTIIVALVFDSSEATLDVLNEWLNVLQSIQIPFALIPLLCLVSKERIMGSFKIGPLCQTIAWLVAALVIMINGYLLIEFFSSEVSGIVYTGFVTVFTALYGAFIVYLIARGINFTPWRPKAESS
uniref:Metal transporter NRAMP3 n=1 Tax=Noccaea caerulescens TaxID=107243 RepID=A6YPU3_NOCCA|nr:metal transporter NRAMP3 [Noccaea caerulescens]